MTMGFPRQEHWSGLPFPSPGDLPDPGINLRLLLHPCIVDRCFTAEPPGVVKNVNESQAVCSEGGHQQVLCSPLESLRGGFLR